MQKFCDQYFINCMSEMEQDRGFIVKEEVKKKRKKGKKGKKGEK